MYEYYQLLFNSKLKLHDCNKYFFKNIEFDEH